MIHTIVCAGSSVMAIWVRFFGNQLVIAGLGGFLLVVGLAAVLGRAGLPDAEQAKKDVLHFLQWRVSQRYMEALKARDLVVPDADMAQRWQEDLERVKRLKIVSVAVARPLPAYLHGWRSDVVKAVIRHPDQSEETRYFYFGPAEVTERSKALWSISF